MDGEPPPADDGGLAALDEAAPDALAAGPGWLAAGAVDALAAGSGGLAVAPDGLGALASMKAWSTPASWRWNNCCRCPGTTWGCCRRWPPSRRVADPPPPPVRPPLAQEVLHQQVEQANDEDDERMRGNTGEMEKYMYLELLNELK